MKKLNKSILLVLSASFFAGCSSTPQEKAQEFAEKQNEIKVEQRDDMLSSIPKWFIDHKTDSAGFYASGTYYSSDLGDAIRQAKTDAKSELAGYYKEFISRQTKNLTRSGASFSDSRKTVTDVFVPEIDISEAVSLKTKVVPEKSGYRAYVLMMVAKESVSNFKTKEDEEFINDALDMEHDTLLKRVEAYKKSKVDKVKVNSETPS